jgi:hypothetical protein
MGDINLKNVLIRLHGEIALSYQLGANLQEENQGQAREALADRLSRESASRNNVDLACRYWIENGAWPQMDEEARVWASDRLAEAYLTAAFLSQQGFVVDSKKTENEILDFLLVEWWKNMVLRRIRAQMMPQSRNSIRMNDTMLQWLPYKII